MLDVWIFIGFLRQSLSFGTEADRLKPAGTA